MFYFLYITLICFSLGETESNGSRLKRNVTNDKMNSVYGDGTTPKKCFYDCHDKPNITYEFDVTNDKMTAVFPLLPLCNHTIYYVTLRVNETLKIDECSGDLPNSLVHSQKEHNKNGSSEVTESNKYGKVEFKNVYSGCYKLVIVPKVNESTQQELNSCAKYIHTGLPKMVIPDNGPLINPIYISERNQFNVDITPNFTYESMTIEVALVNESTELAESEDLVCGIYGVSHSKCTLDSDCYSYSSTSVKLPNCTHVKRKIRCVFYDVTPGNYCIMIKVDDDRCLKDSIWKTNHNCLWRTFVVANDEPIHDISQQSHVIISLAIIVVIIIVFFAGVVVWLLKRRSLWIPAPDEPPDEVIMPMMQKKKVLLLYSRDCECFMDAMKTFGKLLEKIHGVEVFDCFNNEDDLDGPLAWIQRITSNPKICTIIVTSHCAYLQQEAVKSGYAVTSYRLYKEPSYLDAIFIYGLKSIMEDLSPNIYRKVYVIGFIGFSDGDYMLSLPTSFRRYIIPDHLQTLLSDMNVSNHPENYHLKSTVEYVTLQSNIKSLREYTLNYPHYLEEILNLI